MSEAFIDWCGRPVWDGQARPRELIDARDEEAARMRDEVEAGGPDDD